MRRGCNRERASTQRGVSHKGAGEAYKGPLAPISREAGGGETAQD